MLLVSFCLDDPCSHYVSLFTGLLSSSRLLSSLLHISPTITGLWDLQPLVKLKRFFSLGCWAEMHSRLDSVGISVKQGNDVSFCFLRIVWVSFYSKAMQFRIFLPSGGCSAYHSSFSWARLVRSQQLATDIKRTRRQKMSQTASSSTGVMPYFELQLFRIYFQ